MSIMSKVSQAHDTIFKNVFTSRKNALSLLGNFLPSDILNRLDLKEMVYEKDTFVQKHLKAYYSDLIVSIPLLDSDQKIKVYFLFEHKSYSDPDLPLQLLRYIIEIWTHYRKQYKHGKLPFIIPLVITHAESRNRKERLVDIVDTPGEPFKVYLPDFDYLLFDCVEEDLNSYGLEVELKSLLTLWKYAHRPNFFEAVRNVYRMLNQAYPEMEPKDFLIALAQYLYLTRSEEEYEAITEIVKQESRGGINMETIADMLEKKGYERAYQEKPQWVAEGKIDKTRDSIIKLVNSKFGVPQPDIVNRIKTIQSLEVLDALFDYSLRAESMDQFTDQVRKITDN